MFSVRCFPIYVFPYWNLKFEISNGIGSCMLKPVIQIRTRRRIGAALASIAVFTGIIIQATSGKLMKLESQTVQRSASGFFVSGDIRLEKKYFLPLAGIFATGMLCLFWPARKPPVIK